MIRKKIRQMWQGNVLPLPRAVFVWVCPAMRAVMKWSHWVASWSPAGLRGESQWWLTPLAVGLRSPSGVRSPCGAEISVQGQLKCHFGAWKMNSQAARPNGIETSIIVLRRCDDFSTSSKAIIIMPCQTFTEGKMNRVVYVLKKMNGAICVTAQQ